MTKKDMTEQIEECLDSSYETLSIESIKYIDWDDEIIIELHESSYDNDITVVAHDGVLSTISGMVTLITESDIAKDLGRLLTDIENGPITEMDSLFN